MNGKLLNKEIGVLLILFISGFSYILNAQDPIGFHIDANQEVLFGSDLTSPGSKLMWVSSKNAFRAGTFEQNNSNLYSLLGESSVALGAHNTASDTAATALGFFTTASGKASTSMGTFTDASGDYATSIGSYTIASGRSSYAHGSRVTASGDYSTAIGTKVSTNNKQGSLIIGDSDPSDLGYSYIDLADKMMARFANGYEFRTSTGNVTWMGVRIQPGGNAWESISDVNRKENFAIMDDIATLEKLSSIDYSSWNYKNQDPSYQRHYGIMAQEFYELFGVDTYGTIGTDETVNPIDMMGVAMSAIKGASKKIDQATKTIEQLEQENADLKSRIAAIEERLGRME